MTIESSGAIAYSLWIEVAMKAVRISLAVIGVIAALPGLLLLMASVLGINGLLADVSFEENSAIGVRAFWYSLPWFALSLVLIGSSLIASTFRVRER